MQPLQNSEKLEHLDMPPPRISVVAPLKTTRSRITNGSFLHEGVDHRSAPARRYRDLVNAFTSEVGGELTEAERGLVRQAATVSLRAEQLAADLVNGKPVDDDLLIRLAGAARRLLDTIGNKAADRRPASLTLAEYAAQRDTDDE